MKIHQKSATATATFLLSLFTTTVGAEETSLLRRKTIKVGKNDCPPGSKEEDCEPRPKQNVPCEDVKSPNLKKACPGADECIYMGGFTEYECGCDPQNAACEEDAECLDGYTLEREPQGAKANGSNGGNGFFYACNNPE